MGDTVAGGAGGEENAQRMVIRDVCELIEQGGWIRLPVYDQVVYRSTAEQEYRTAEAVTDLDIAAWSDGSTAYGLRGDHMRYPAE